MNKWIITLVAAFGFILLALTAHLWAPPLLLFARGHKEPIESLNTFADLISKLVMWPAAAILFIFGLWQKRKEDAAGRQSRLETKSGRDTNAAGRDIQTGGASVKGNASVNGDVFGGDKRIEGDLFTGDKTTTTSGTVIKAENVTINQGVTPASAPQLTPLYQLPPPPADFTGRTTELAELRAAIEKGGVHISGLQGQGGVGKTALALKFAAELAPNYPDAQIYLDLKGVSDKPLTAADALSHVLRTFHPEAKLPEKEEDLRAQYLSVLHNKRVLLLMDNAKDAIQAKPLIPPEGCALLVTSRQHFALPGLKAKNLETLPQPDAKDLLLRIAPRIDGEAETIAKLCGYLPQALRLAASAIAVRMNLEPQDYARQLADEKKRLELLAGDDESVTASITLSCNLLDVEIRKRWRMLGVFPDTFDPLAAAAVWELETDAAKDTISHLLKFSMLEWNEATSRYSLHDLMGDFARKLVTTTELESAGRLHAKHYLIVTQSARNLYNKGGESIMRGLGLFDTEWANIRSGQAWAAIHAGEDEDAAKLCNDYPQRAGYMLRWRLHPRERIRWDDAGLASARRLKDRKGEGFHLGSLGMSYRSLGNYPRATECLDLALAISREIKDRIGEGYDLLNLGNVYSSLDDTQRASELYERALAIAREMGDRTAQGMLLVNLGLVQNQLHEYRSAISNFEQALAINRDIEDPQVEGNALGGLGGSYFGLKDYTRSIEYFQKDLEIDRKIGNIAGEGTSLWNIGNAFHSLGDRKSCYEHVAAALKILEQIESPHAEMVRKQFEKWH